MKTVIWIILIVVIAVQIIRWIIDRMEGKPRNRRANDGSDSGRVRMAATAVTKSFYRKKF